MPQIEKLVSVMRETADVHGAKPAQIAAAWAIAKGTLPIIGVTKTSHVEDAAEAASIALSEKEIALMESAADELSLAKSWCEQ